MVASSSQANCIDFRDIPVVPNSTQLKDICLSRVQRRTPNEIHKQFEISRIRSFYMRKVKFLEECFLEKLDAILIAFPHVDKIHPFHSDIINILYDRDHFKIALGQLNICRNLIKNISNDYIKLLKYSESAYRCKSLKVAAFGRMAKLVDKQNECLSYLESVRQHLSRLPRIDPNQRTLLLTGAPNVGKSSLLNAISAANSQVECYEFTTKSLFLGQTEAFGLRYQVIDTPGLLDRSGIDANNNYDDDNDDDDDEEISEKQNNTPKSTLSNRNSIEMLTLSALTNLSNTPGVVIVIFMFDLSETCGTSLLGQIGLFEELKRSLLFEKKSVLSDQNRRVNRQQMLIAFNKCDQFRFKDLTEEYREKMLEVLKDFGGLDAFYDGINCDNKDLNANDNNNDESRKNKYKNNATIFEISTKENININNLKLSACKRLLKERIEVKLRSFKKAEESAKMLKIYYTNNNNNSNNNNNAQENKIIGFESIFKDFFKGNNQNGNDDIDFENMEIDDELFERIAQKIIEDPRVMSKIDDSSQIYDKIPELYMGYNVQDFMGKKATSRLEELVEEERDRNESNFYELPELPETNESKERQKLLKTIRDHKLKCRKISQLKNNRTHTKITGKAKALMSLSKKMNVNTDNNNNNNNNQHHNISNKRIRQRYFANSDRDKLLSNNANDINNMDITNESNVDDVAEHEDSSNTKSKKKKFVKKSNEKQTKDLHRQREKNFNRLPAHIFKGKANKKGRIF